MRRFAVLATLALAVAACGGGGASLYTKQKTSACLTGKGVKVGPVSTVDFVANSATGGTLSAKLADDAVTISFGLTLTDASNIDEAYRRFHAKNVGIDDILRDQRNAVMLWRTHPSDADVALVTGCLKG